MNLKLTLIVGEEGNYFPLNSLFFIFFHLFYFMCFLFVSSLIANCQEFFSSISPDYFVISCAAPDRWHYPQMNRTRQHQKPDYSCSSGFAALPARRPLCARGFCARVLPKLNDDWRRRRRENGGKYANALSEFPDLWMRWKNSKMVRLNFFCFFF